MAFVSRCVSVLLVPVVFVFSSLAYSSSSIPQLNLAEELNAFILEGLSSTSSSALGGTSDIKDDLTLGIELGSTIDGLTPLPFSIEDKFATLQALSDAIAALATTGFIEYKWGGVFLNGDCESDIQVFNLNGDQLLNSAYFVLNCVPETSTLVVNIDGDVAGFNNIGLSHINFRSSRTIYNFNEATRLEFTWFGIGATVLAPGADVVNPLGFINDTVIAKSWNGLIALYHNSLISLINSLFPNENSAPVFSSEPTLETFYGELYQYQITAADSDLDDLEYTLAEAPSGASLSPGNLLEWTPSITQVGDNSFVVSVSDGAVVVNQEFIVQVLPSNTAPVFSPIEDQTLSENDVIQIILQVLDNENDTLEYSVSNSPAFLTLNDNVLTLQPSYSDAGIYSDVSVAVSDGEFTTSAVFDIEVSNTNRAPSFMSAPVLTAAEDFEYRYQLAANDPDENSQLLFEVVSGPAGITFDEASLSLVWIPTQNDVGDHDVVVQVTDAEGGIDTQSFTIVVSNTNDAPIVSNVIANVLEDEEVQITLNAIDEDGDSLIFEVLVPPSSGKLLDTGSGVYIFTPAENFYGEVSFTYRATDGLAYSNSALADISVSPVNDNPVITSLPITAVNENESYIYSVMASDVDDDTLIYSVSAPEGFEIDSATGFASWTPTAIDLGVHEVTVSVTDSAGAIDSQSFSLEVVNVNDSPQLISVPIVNAQEGTLYSYFISSSDPDEDDTLTYELVVAPPGMSISPQLGYIEWTPNFVQSGLHAVEIKVSDNEGLFDVQSFQINVENTNRAPSISSSPSATVDVSGVYQYQIIANDPDIDDTVSIQLVSGPDGMNLYPQQGLLEWAPEVEGSYSVSVAAVDVEGASDVQVFSIDVVTPNDPPALTLRPLSAEVLYKDVDLITLVAQATDSEDGDISEAILWHSDLDGQLGSGNSIARRFTAGLHDISVSVSDSSGQITELNFELSVEEQALPVDPASVAPVIDSTHTTPFLESVSFLYSGTSPIQVVEDPSVFEKKRIGVLTGRVLNRSGDPVSGIRVSVQGYPEFGYTLTRVDGQFDIAANGGGDLTVNFERTGYLTVQRTINLPWEQFAVLDDVVILGYDPIANPIDLLDTSKAFQVGHGSMETDSDGDRRATVLFPQGTQATMVFEDGTELPLTEMTFRATEYTVGENGPQAMPGALPMNSAYTYAVELSIDEAVELGATRVNFSQALPFYVDNFLSFPVGESIPLGWFDRARAIWVPAPDGKVISVVGLANEKAQLDIDGDGVAEDSTALDTMGITEQELAEIARLYPQGSTFWRMMVDHFTPWDCNEPGRLPNDAYAPPANNPGESNDPRESEDSQNTDQCPGCVIDPQRQVLGEDIDLVGTNESLHYRTDRVTGRKISRIFEVEVSNDRLIPGTLRGMIGVARVAGKTEIMLFAPAKNLKWKYEWDGLDKYGRQIPNAKAHITIFYLYRLDYSVSRSEGNASFNRISRSGATIGSRTATAIPVFRRYSKQLYNVPNLSSGLGAWTLNSHHHYDPTTKTLFYGNGDIEKTTNLPNLVFTAIGNGTVEPGEDGNALEVGLPGVGDIDHDSQGRVYYSGGGVVRRLNLDGTVTTVVGSGELASSGDGGLATEAGISPSRLAIAPDGTMYISDNNANNIRKVDTNGIITTFAGTGASGYTGDNGLAVDATFSLISDIAWSPDGNLFVTDANNYVVRKIDPNGIITTYAGNGIRGVNGFDGIAPIARMRPSKLAFGAENDLYVGDLGVVARIRSDGIIQAPENAGTIDLSVVESDARGRIYFNIGSRLHRLNLDGSREKIIGGGRRADALVDGIPAHREPFFKQSSLTVLPNNDIYYYSWYGKVIRKVTSSLPGGHAGDIGVPSKDGTEVYIFNENGRHKHTVDAITGQNLLTFGYDHQGLLSDVTDIDGLKISVNRNSDGTPISIAAPYGQVTELNLDANGYLSRVTNPAGESNAMTYTDQGLLTSKNNPRGFTNTFEYDELGLLTKDIAPNGGWEVSTEEVQDDNGDQIGVTSILSTPLGTERKFKVEYLSEEDSSFLSKATRFTNTATDGTESVKTVYKFGRTEVTNADGMSIISVNGPDPRFGMIAPVPESQTITTPSGLTKNITVTRAINLFSLEDISRPEFFTETVNVNDKVSTNHFDANNATWTYTSPEGRAVTRTIDEKGRTVLIEVPALADTEYVYDDDGRVEVIQRVASGVDAETRVQSYRYDSNGYADKITDNINQSMSLLYDSAGRITHQLLTGERDIVSSFDDGGNLSSVTTPNNTVFTYGYSGTDKTTSFNLPSLNGSTVGEAYSYTDDDILSLVTFASGDTRLSIRNDKQQVTRIEETGRTINYEYNPTTGQLASYSSEGTTVSYTYDGSLLKTEGASGEVTGNISYEYDNDFRVSSIALNANAPVQFNYDDDNLLTQAGEQILEYAPDNGQLVAKRLEGLEETLAYNPFGELKLREIKYNGSLIFSSNLEYDAIGRVKSKTETLNGQTDVIEYTYDVYGSLATVTTNGITTESYAYDKNGNRVSGSVNGATRVGTPDARDRLVSYGEYSFSYDANGALASKMMGPSLTSYTSDANRNLRRVQLPSGDVVTYHIDGQDRRVGKSINGVRVQGFIYLDQINPIAELDGSGNVVAEFVYGTKINIPEYMIKGGKTYRIVSDRLGSPRLVIDTENGDITQAMAFDAYGNVLVDTNPGFQPFGFAGGIYDRDTGLIKFGYRDYDSVVGRFVQSDPIGLGGGIHTYAYVNGNPVSYVDPLGLLKYNTPDTSRTGRLTGETLQFANCMEKCAGYELTVTGGSEKKYHGKNSKHYTGQACDFSKKRNPKFDRKTAEKCFNKCAKSTYFGQQEGGRQPHFHFQIVPGRNNSTGFRSGVH